MGKYDGATKESAWTWTLSRIAIGVVLKFMLGSDDLVWLSPFMARARTVSAKVDIGFKYVMSVLFLTLLACALAVLIHFAAHHGEGDEIIDQSIATVAAFLLFAYAVHMAHEQGYFDPLVSTGVDEDEEDEKSATKEANEGGEDYGTMRQPEKKEELGPFKKAVRDAILSAAECCDSYCSCVDADTRELSKDLDDDDEQGGVVVVAFLGSMDDFMVYFTLALSHELTWFELTAGVTIGGILIALIVGALLQSSETLANAVESIPIPVVLTGLSIFILVSAWTSFDGF